MKAIVPLYSDREAIVAAVLRDAVYYRDLEIIGKYSAANAKKSFAHPETLTTTRPGSEQEYHLVKEIEPLARLIEQKTQKTILRSWANINKSGHWLGPHAHTKDNVSTVVCYYAQAGDGEILRFKDEMLTTVNIKENMFLAFDSSIIHFFDGKDRVKDKITLTFELI